MKKLFTFLMCFLIWNIHTKAQTVSTFAGSSQGYATGSGTAAQFNRPYGIAFDGGGAVVLTDQGNGRVRKIFSDQSTGLLAGNGYTSNINGTGAAASFGALTGIARDGFNNAYICDASYHVIKKITSAGVVTTVAGGTQGTNDGTGTAAQFYFPYGIASDLNGILYVADTYNHRIRKITTTGVVTTLAGSTEGYIDATGTAAQFAYPTGIAIDANNNVYVSENSRIRKITPAGVVTTLASGFSGANGIAIDNDGNLYVAVSQEYRIKKITPAGVVSNYVGLSYSGSVDGDASNATFNLPTGITIDKNTNILYVADNENHRIRKIVPPASASTPLISSTINTSVTAYGVSITYTVTANNANTTTTIKYGLASNALTNQYNGFSATGSTANTQAVSIPNLQPNTTYYFQIEATNSEGSATSSVLNFTTSSAPTPALIAQYNFDGSYNNINGNTPFASNAGTSFTNDRQGIANKALNINNTGTTATITNLPYGNSPRTIAFWAKVNTMLSDYNMTFSYGQNAPNNANGGSFSPNDVSFLGYNNNYQAANINTAGTWYFFTYTYDGTTAKIYKNGALIGSSAKTWNTLNNSDIFKLGIGVGGELWFNGAIDDLKIYNYPLNDTEITNLYIRNTTSSLPQSIAEYNFDNTYNNINGNTPFTSNAGTSFTTDRHGNTNGALNLNGTIGTSVAIANLPVFNQTRTISLWIKPNQVNADNIIFSYGIGTGNNIYGASFNASTLYNFTYSSNLAYSTTVNANVWKHVVYTYNQATGIAKIYVNGVATISGVYTAWNTTNSGYFYLGVLAGVNGNAFNGAIDDLKIYNEELSDTYIANLYNTNTLPVTLTSYTAKAQNNTAVLNWETETETNNSHFIIKKSSNGVDFSELTTVIAKSANGAKYQFLDHNPANGTNYYQLLQVDLDGKTTDLGVKTVSFSIKDAVKVFPNPTADKAEITFNAGSYNNAKLTDMNGKVLQNISISKLQQGITLNVSNYSKGLYLLQLIGDKESSTQKIIKQ